MDTVIQCEGGEIMDKRIVLLPLIALMLGTIVVPAYAVTYDYDCIPLGHDASGDPMFRAVTNDPNMYSGKVRFWLYLDLTCHGGDDKKSDFVYVSWDGVGFYAEWTFAGYGDTEICVKAHFQQSDAFGGESYWSECITVPWFTSLPVAMMISIGGIAILKKKKRI